MIEFNLESEVLKATNDWFSKHFPEGKPVTFKDIELGNEFWDLDGCWWEKRTERYGIQWIQGEPVERRDFRPDEIVRRK